MQWFLIIFIFISPEFAWATNKGFALSGGISLGSYEAGAFYRLIIEDKEKIAKETKVVFGTSAGSINGLLGVLDICSLHQTTRESGLLWKMWIPIGLDQLEAKDKHVQSLFDRKAINPIFDEVKARWKEGLSADCDLRFGVAVSRKEPFNIEIRPGLEIVRQSEFFIIRIRGQGPGKYPIVENQNYTELKSFRSYLPVGESPEKDVQILLDLVQASSAFPGAFTAYPIKFCFTKPGEKFSGCQLKDTQEELFIDGGLYHNGPVGYAYQALKQGSKDKDLKLYYLNASSPLIGQKNVPKEVKEKEKDQDIFKEFYKLFANFIVQARKFELDKSLEINPEIAKHVETNPKHFPLVSEPLYAFLGFLETDFRKSDFYLGMYDEENDGHRKNDVSDAEYNCFKERLISSESACELDQNLVILINLAKYRKEAKLTEPDFDTVYDYLQKKHFAFKDLGMNKDESKLGKIYTKKRLTQLLERYSKRQSNKQHYKLSYFIRPTLNFLQYTPPDRYWYAVYASSPEIGFSSIIPQKYFGTSPFRIHMAGMLNGFSNFFNRSQDIWAFTPLVGIEYEPLWLNSAIWQWHAGLRGGYVLSPRDDLGRGECDTELAEENPGACSGGTVQMYLALSVLERIRVQFVYIPLVVNSFSFDEKPELLLQVGIQFEDLF